MAICWVCKSDNHKANVEADLCFRFLDANVAEIADSRWHTFEQITVALQRAASLGFTRYHITTPIGYHDPSSTFEIYPDDHGDRKISDWSKEIWVEVVTEDSEAYECSRKYWDEDVDFYSDEDEDEEPAIYSVEKDYCDGKEPCGGDCRTCALYRRC